MDELREVPRKVHTLTKNGIASKGSIMPGYIEVVDDVVSCGIPIEGAWKLTSLT